MSGFEWLDEIERRADAAAPELTSLKDLLEFVHYARSTVPRLCGAVRELAEALDEATDWLRRQGDKVGAWKATELRKVLERWRRGGA